MIFEEEEREDDVFDDDDDEIDDINKRKRKRKKKASGSKNPLSFARGKQQSHENIWFRRSGAGYDLFVQYYSQQPMGTVCCSSSGAGGSGDDNRLLAAVPSATIEHQQQQQQESSSGNGGGQSRAAKRRRKKKKTTATTAETQQQQKEEGKPTAPNPPTSKTTKWTTTRTKSHHHQQQHPLLLSFHRYCASTSMDANNKNNSEQQLEQDNLQSFFESMSRPLPITFRIRRHLNEKTAQQLKEEIHSPKFFWKSDNTTTTKNDPHSLPQLQVRPLPPPIIESNNNNNRELQQNHCRHGIFQTNCSKSDLKQFPVLKEFLFEHSQNGTIARQELGSMLPLLVLEAAGCFMIGQNNNNGIDEDGRPGKKKKKKKQQHKQKRKRVLDLCASPGSKTLQALELLLLMDNNDINNNSSSKGPAGMILANDVSESRLESLRDAIHRSGMMSGTTVEEEDDEEGQDEDDHDNNNNNTDTPTVNKMIKYSCQDARYFSTATSTTTTKKQRLWDVIICDVPCSGDGTIRKDPHILEMWKPSQGYLLHPTQLQILHRGLQLLKPGGTLCYSTCSLNPIENEAVVVAAINQYNNNNNNMKNKKKTDNNENENDDTIIELIEFPTFPAGSVGGGSSSSFRRRPGISTWKVADYYHDDNDNDNDGSSKTTTRRASGQNTMEDDDDDDDERPNLIWYDTYQDYCRATGTGTGTDTTTENNENIKRRRKKKKKSSEHDLPKTLWPPLLSSLSASDESCGDDGDEDPSQQQQQQTGIPLQNCTRLWPQDYDSGGFFLALLRKTKVERRKTDKKNQR